MRDRPINPWSFVSADGTFLLPEPHRTSCLYFPLVNEAGMMSAITPELQGDAKTGQHSFLLPPVTAEDLHHASYGRNFWLRFSSGTVWSVAGRSAQQRAEQDSALVGDQVQLEAGFLWHKLVRRNARLGIRTETTNFVPARDCQAELMRVEIKNIGEKEQTITATAAIPIFGRSADNVRDHRHVTSLLHRICTTKFGVVVRPTLSFDERGHTPNAVSYGVCGSDPAGAPPVGYFPTVPDFVGEGGALDWPKAVVDNQEATATDGASLEGYEAMGALRFKPFILPPGGTVAFRLVMSVGQSSDHSCDWAYLCGGEFERAFHETQQFWQAKLNRLVVRTGNEDFDRWLRWVTLQPMLRRIYGCSFLPHHDYGRGGRGWRDLWQDCLALVLAEPEAERQQLRSNFAGVRIDGSNVARIGQGEGSFLDDRNHIPRVWMDHGAWPWVTTKAYIDQTGDLSFLLEKQSYYRDALLRRCKHRDDTWTAESGTLLQTARGKPYLGSILEHLLVQHLTAFFNVGANNNILLENADWNDALDMAHNRGESVAFTSLYGGNLLEIAETLTTLEERSGVQHLDLLVESLVLLDTVSGNIDYSSPAAKRKVLTSYLDSCTPSVSGERHRVPLRDVAKDLRRKGNAILEHVRSNEWVQTHQGYGWFNGYYDDEGQRLDGPDDRGVRLGLTGQVFALLSGAATEEQANQVVASVKHYLWDERIGGCRLNTPYEEFLVKLGRCSGFAYGHKENGAVFCHMAVMYANALYARGFAREGHRVLSTLYSHGRAFEQSRILPGIPEYFDARGRGMYHYLTGAASWYVLTLVTRVFGVCGRVGDLELQPRLMLDQFDQHLEASVEFSFAERKLRVVYHNPDRKETGEYTITDVSLAGRPVRLARMGQAVVIPRSTFEKLETVGCHELRALLG